MPEGELPTAKAKKLITEIAELKPDWVIIEGGEPLLRDDLFDLLHLMRQKQLDIHLITSGMLLSTQIITSLKQLGVKIMVSIDGATQATYETIRSRANFETVVRAAHNCAKEGILEALNFTVLKANFREISGIFELAASIGKPKVTLIGLKPCQDYSARLLTSQEYREAIELACKGAQKTGVEFFFDEPFFRAAVSEWELFTQTPNSSAGILAPSTSACIFGEYVFIETDGDVKPCSFAPLVLGNVNEKYLCEIWHDVLDSPFFHQIKDHKTRTGHCQSCRYLADCRGCRSRTFTMTGDWFSPDPACPLGTKLTAKQGL
jgi:radical SAM protein with 4Fe4S-binding SPASM domain